MNEDIRRSKTRNGNKKRSRTRNDNIPAARADRSVYQPTAREQQALSRQMQRAEAEVPLPPLKFERDGDSLNVLLEHRNSVIGCSLLREALGSASDAFVEGIFRQLETARSPHEPDLNFALSVIKNVKPNDQLETMLAAQMAVTHMATMMFASRLARANSVEQCDSAERAYNKLARTFVAQMEALKRYRTGGEQKVTVQHVSVNDGGQAIVGERNFSFSSLHLPAKSLLLPSALRLPADRTLCKPRDRVASNLPRMGPKP